MINFEVASFVGRFLKNFGVDYVDRALDSVRKLKVLVVGEAIIDEYCYGRAIGKSSKDPMIALKHEKEEKYAGGVLAVANHLSSFCDRVDLLTMLGEQNSQEDFIKKSLAGNIVPYFFYRNNAATIVKRRFLEIMPLTKLLELYIMDDGDLDEQQSLLLTEKLEKVLPAYDLVICVDYGHGFIDKRAAGTLASQSRFFAVNTQANAGNMGYHTISKYDRADFICLNEPEARLERRNKNGDLIGVVEGISQKMSCELICVTRGNNGCLTYGGKKAFNIPAFTDRVVDRVGSGDAFLAITSLLLKNKEPMEVVGLIGNAIGALAVNSVGNKKPINKEELVYFIKSMFNKIHA